MDIGGAISVGPAQGSLGINQLTGDVTAGPADGSAPATLVGTANVHSVIATSPAIVNITPVLVRRSATATAGIAEATEFIGSTAGQTITAPVAPPTSTMWRIVNDSTVTVNIVGGTNSLNIGGTIYGASTPYTLPIGQALDFVYDSTGIWTEMSGVGGGGTTITTITGTWAGVALTSGAATQQNTATIPNGTYLLTVWNGFYPTANATVACLCDLKVSGLATILPVTEAQSTLPASALNGYGTTVSITAIVTVTAGANSLTINSTATFSAGSYSTRLGGYTLTKIA